MFDMAINSPTRTQSAVRVPAGPQVKAAPKQTPNLDVIDLSKPPTPEQAERLRNSGILGYGAVDMSDMLSQRGELLDQIDKYAGQLHRGFDTHA